MKGNMVKILANLMPVSGFFITYQYSGIIQATGIFILLSTIALILESLYFRKEPTMFQVFSIVALICFGSATFLLRDPVYIKLKPTFIYSFIGFTFLYSALLKKNLGIKLLSKLTDTITCSGVRIDWCLTLSCFLCAAINELVWRNFSEEVWVRFKIFFLPVIIVTLLSVILIMSTKTNQLIDKDDNNSA